MRRYGEALCAEIKAWASFIPEEEKRLESVYLGGGTPSTMKGGEVSNLLRQLTRSFPLRSEAEVTVEVNPATWSPKDFRMAAEGGFNRFSMGVQSLDGDVLRLLGRRYGPDDARSAVKQAMAQEDAVVSADILYSLPLGGKGAILRTLEELAGFGVHHISAYPLTLEKGSPFYEVIRKAGLCLPGDDECAEQYDEILAKLRDLGYGQYEVSNFSEPGYHCRHNLAYWKREHYLGLGAGAHSLLYRCRFYNISSVLRYIVRLESGDMAVEGCRILGEGEELEETIMLGMRTADGLPEEMLQSRWDAIEGMESLDLLNRNDGRISLTGKGMFLSNAVIGELLYERRF
jgi:oxygen-independent coproporphyrinogen-3 oxidase